ncbi:MAG: hypothetical protein JWM35_748 [Verrucomicrobia bacterium]|nr:hypothetical protein [Verrucomicrobiota bacterium]
MQLLRLNCDEVRKRHPSLRRIKLQSHFSPPAGSESRTARIRAHLSGVYSAHKRRSHWASVSLAVSAFFATVWGTSVASFATVLFFFVIATDINGKCEAPCCSSSPRPLNASQTKGAGSMPRDAARVFYFSSFTIPSSAAAASAGAHPASPPPTPLRTPCGNGASRNRRARAPRIFR